MRISTNQVFLRGLYGMQTRQVEMLRLQEQASTGKKIRSPSDDPIAAASIDLMKQRIAGAESLQQNRNAAAASLSNEESILGNAVGVMQKVRELQVQAGNNALSEADRKAIADEAQNLLKQLQSLANSQDSSGYYIFSGGKSLTQTITQDASGSYSFNGDETQRKQLVTSGLYVPMNDSGADVFMRIPNGNGRFAVSTPGTNTGTSYMTTGSVVNEAAYVADNYTISFAQNTAGETVVMVTGTISGSVIPASGLVDDAPVYESGKTLNFNGIEITPAGDPAIGDSYIISPSRDESVFSTMSRMIANLQKPFTSASDKAATQTENNQLMSQIDASLNNILSYQVQTGARLNQLEVAETINNDLIVNSKDALSLLEDADLGEVLVSMELQKVYLQIAQQSFASIQGLSLFNYI